MTSRAAVRSRRVPRAAGPAAGVAALLLLGACSPAGPSGDARAGDVAPSIGGVVTVFAAASLEETFAALAETFEKSHPGTEVTLSLGGSDGLAAGIAAGAPADVFAAADPVTMKTVADAGETAGAPVVFARNRLEIATRPGNPDGITSLGDLARTDLKVVVCAETVPCGSAARKALSAGGVRLTPSSYEEDVRGALTKVRLDEADAALVYRTDVAAAGDAVGGVDFPEAAEATNDYPIARLRRSENPDAGQAFLDLVTSAEGRRVLDGAGFLAP
ncbi:molybdate ABC transporter substrate-binding protein [Streptomyces sp. HSG2]|uniref:molybdate ABC transporter substrate-binding protein n=1 Tax=Streptomyces sp. HSG2 TaxID=2797167 RepID=UPI001903647A|nr:molybdate ABC transporter substrate-binding protein [Streptomyces sp. HSG2]